MTSTFKSHTQIGHRKWLWCKISGVGEDGGMSRFDPVEEMFAGRHFDAKIVVLCVRSHLSFKLSYRDLVRMMEERVFEIVTRI